MQLVLESFTPEQLKYWQAHAERHTEFEHFYFEALAGQRAFIRPRLAASLLKEARPFEFEGWCRIVDYPYTLDPLSSQGSLAYIGGRFNVGQIDPSRFPPFPALYLASDHSTAFFEKFGNVETDRNKGLRPEDQALARPGSHTEVSLKGRLAKVLVIDEGSLRRFVQLTRSFKLPRELHTMARELKMPKHIPSVVQTSRQLVRVLSIPEWRYQPAYFNVPANSQIVAELARAGGVEGIRYRSSRGSGWCLAVFPDNLKDAGSFVEIAGKTPKELKQARLEGPGSEVKPA